ncbi:hypothetical protein GCM10018980_76350 [Streptomyces capoamus]|uniref:Teneurin NHL domain-containing protein n=2 Tax=Streptomyces capoamus TaxID=68183 RepID=A0A919KGK7_9ACTN|nr:hypothetical protein GCM10010501_15180 [Streptomyces libani subsp. rufus]GHG77795.1 hypothetical protein GCM10018980_76350 [Streptomyces capoamus]
MSTAQTAATGHRVCKVMADGKIRTVAGAGVPGSSGDGGLAIDARLHGPVGVAVDSTNTLYIADHKNHRVRKVTADGKISTFVGTNTPGSGGDSSLAASAQLNYPMGLALDSTDALYIADYANNQIRKVASARLPQSGTVACWTNAMPAADCGWPSCESPPRTEPEFTRTLPSPGTASGGG